MKSRCVVFAVALALGLPASAWAENLVLGFDTQTGWDDNVFFSTEDEEDAFPYRFSPWAELKRERGDLTYALNASVIYEDFFDQSNADAVDAVLRFNGLYRVSEATEFTFNEQFSRVQSLSRRLETEDPTGDVVPDIENRRQRSMRNALSVGMRHALSRRWSLNANLSDTFFDFQDDELVDSNAAAFSTSLSYSISPRDQVGFGLGATRQDFEATTQIPSSETTFYRAFGNWSHRFSPTLSMSLQAGPTWIETSSDAGFSTSRFTYFGAANVTKRWETVSVLLGYNRTDSSASGFSGSTVLDSVNASVVWKPSERWNLALLGNWTRRQSATTQFAQEFVLLPSPPNPPLSFDIVLREIDTDDTVDQIRFEARGERRITRYLSVFSNVIWLQQQRDIASFSDINTTQERFQVIVGIRWRTQPFFF